MMFMLCTLINILYGGCMQHSNIPSHSCHGECAGVDIQQICGFEARCLLSSWFLCSPYFMQSVHTLSTAVMEGSAKQV